MDFQEIQAELQAIYSSHASKKCLDSAHTRMYFLLYTAKYYKLINNTAFVSEFETLLELRIGISQRKMSMIRINFSPYFQKK